MATIIDPPNSVWPNGLKVDTEGYVTFYQLGTNKVDISTITWPDGDKLISPFVYQNDKLVGFVDTEALTVVGSATTTMNYNHIEADFSSIPEGKLTVNAPNATVKKFKWSVVESGDDNVVITLKYKGCKTVNDIKAVDPNYQTTDIVDSVWSEGLGDLTDGTYMFNNCTALISFYSDLSSLTNGDNMFNYCRALTSFNSDLSSLTNGTDMFNWCSKLASFSSDLSSLTNAMGMFAYCYSLKSFSSDLSSLTNGAGMFTNCKLDTVSVQHIADTINTVSSGNITIFIGNSTPNNQEEAAFNTIASKGWSVYVNGNSNSNKWNPTSLTPIDGEEQQTPIPFWAKPVQTDEKYAQYVDSEGNFFNILGGQFIYGDDLSTYGMFTCEEDAAANMRLTKIEKGDK